MVRWPRPSRRPPAPPWHPMKCCWKPLRPATTPPSTTRSSRVVSDFEPAGDQPKAIAELTEGIERGDRFQTLLGITGSGKSATIAWTIEQVQKPDADPGAEQVAGRPAGHRRCGSSSPTTGSSTSSATTTTTSPRRTSRRSDTYIEKDSSINDEIDRLRHSRHGGAADPPRHHRGRVGQLHLRHGQPRGVPGQPARSERRASTTTSAASCAGSSTCSTIATT